MASYTWEFYQDNAKFWRWRKTSSNGEIVAASHEGFASKQGAIENARKSGYTG